MIVCCAFSVGAQAQDVTVNPDNLKELIETLESESAREEFIDNLKTLKETQEAQDKEPAGTDVPISLSHNWQFDKYLSQMSESYRAFLAEHNLNTSFVGQTLMTFIALCVYLGLGLFIRKSMLSARDRLLQLQEQYALRHDRFRLYTRMIRYSLYIILSAIFIYVASAIWDITDFAFLKTEATAKFIGNFLSLLLVIMIAIVIWEAINGFIELAMRRAHTRNASRLRTLLPIAQNVLFVVFLVLFTLVVLSELGINIMPLLAGAGIFGVAIGFGAQSMVKDFLTGFTIILEDLIQVGDVVTLGGKTGLIEKITIRKVQLRDLSGIVYTVPFSNIDIVENLTKDYSYYLMDVGVAYREDTDNVIEHLKAVDEELRADERFKDLILGPLEILGVDAFADSAVIIKARIKTRPIKQWDVGREFNRRMKYRFDAHDIEIPFPHQTLYFGADKDGKAPPAQIALQDQTAIGTKAKPAKPKNAKK